MELKECFDGFNGAGRVVFGRKALFFTISSLKTEHPCGVVI
ncbi:hypothetical protein AGR7C_Lc140144 [Agrobacterium deltaense Zutra 3/1]|uniref:Uncharacterized protein n=1 Tax=Agrobacterium deltaense Zutra 3/1 TaxID=1183427 RepID=A0A1S7RAQ6_9HYPH|nr:MULTISPECIES: hypothetical protein [Agrobacterium]CUX49689.1 hypothetical protein AGR7C_Lc140144 [Agrobacterium deltaense Zutra 3/1]